VSTVTRSSLVLALALAEAAGAAEPESAASAPSAPSSALLWASRGAETLRQGRWQLALFGQSHYGLADGVELALQPLVFLV
jgi:hypothetical protein